MPSNKGTTPAVSSPTTRTVYDRAPKPKPSITPRREYAFMRNYSLVWAQAPTSNFGPFSGGASL